MRTGMDVKRLLGVAFTLLMFFSGVRLSLADFSERQRLAPLGSLGNIFFGCSVSIDGNVALVGARGDDNGNRIRTGSATVFRHNGSSWVREQKLLAADGARDARFGDSVSIDGDVALVGAPHHLNQGTAYVFRRSGATWVQMQKLVAANRIRNAQFGGAVCIDGNVAIVGAWADDNGNRVRTGSATVFRHSGSTWMQVQKLLASDGTRDARFGYSVAIDGNIVLVGAPHHQNQGAVYVYQLEGGNWRQVQRLSAADGARDARFGESVSIHGNFALVGAPHHLNEGAAYVFRRSGATWMQMQKLVAANRIRNAQFGSAVSVDQNIAIVGATGDDNGKRVRTGSATVYRYNGSSWVRVQKLLATDGTRDARFGDAVSIDGKAMLVGSPHHNGQGSGYVFR